MRNVVVTQHALSRKSLTGVLKLPWGQINRTPVFGRPCSHHKDSAIALSDRSVYRGCLLALHHCLSIISASISHHSMHVRIGVKVESRNFKNEWGIMYLVTPVSCLKNECDVSAYTADLPSGHFSFRRNDSSIAYRFR